MFDIGRRTAETIVGKKPTSSDSQNALVLAAGQTQVDLSVGKLAAVSLWLRHLCQFAEVLSCAGGCNFVQLGLVETVSGGIEYRQRAHSAKLHICAKRSNRRYQNQNAFRLPLSVLLKSHL